MKYLRKFNESTVQDWRESMSHKSKEMHRNNCKEFYLVTPDRYVQKYIIPEQFRGDFEEQYTGGDYGQFFKDTAEFVAMYADDTQAQLVIMDYEIDNFIKELQNSKSAEGYDIEKEDA